MHLNQASCILSLDIGLYLGDDLIVINTEGHSVLKQNHLISTQSISLLFYKASDYLQLTD